MVNNKELTPEKLKLSYVKNKLSEDKINSWDVLSTFYHILSMTNDENFIKQSFNKIREFYYNNNEQNKDIKSIINDITNNEAFEKIGNIDLGNNYTPETFINNYADSLLKFFSDFDGLTGIENSLDYESMEFFSNVHMLSELFPESKDKILEYINVYANTKQNQEEVESSFNKSEEARKDVNRWNRGIYPENEFEIAEDGIIIAGSAVAVVFPPSLIVATIIYLLRANNNKTTVKAFKKIDNIKKKAINKVSENIAESEEYSFNKFRERIVKNKERIERLHEALPESWKNFIKKDTMPRIMNKYMDFLDLTNEKEKLSTCNAHIENLNQAQNQSKSPSIN